jgi:hypothetical protein
MPQLKKDIGKSKIRLSKTVIVTKTTVPVKSTLFAKKITKINELLSKATLLHSQT